MQYRNYSRFPERMVALSIFPPPLALDPRAPFGFGAFIITRRWRDEAEFTSNAQGYGAGYDPERMRSHIETLFTPETTALIHIPATPFSRRHELAPMPYSSSYSRYVPRCGLRRNIHAVIPHDQLVHAARIGGISIHGPNPTAIQRIARLHTEAQAAWLFWVIAARPPRIRRSVLAGYMAWTKLQKAKGCGSTV